MKKSIYLCTLVLLSLLLSSHKANAYSINYHSYYDSCTSGSFYAMVSDSSGTSSLETSYGDGTTDTNTITYGYAHYSHNYTSSGSYTVKMVWIRAGVRVDSVSFTITHSACGYIYGRQYHDVNTNCIYDAGDVPLWYSSQIEVDSAGHPVDTIYGYNTFGYRVYTSGISYSFKVLSTTTGLTLACPTTGTLTATSSVGSSVNAGDFGYQCVSSSSFDAHVYMSSRSGRHSNYIYVELISNSCTGHSGTLTVNFDSRYSYYGSTPSGGSVSGHTVTFSYSNLSIDTPKYFMVHAEKSPWLTVGTPTTNEAYIDHMSGDTNYGDDTVIHTDTVTSSFDPNDKQVYPTGNIAAGSTLTYTLAFENTGNAPATNIHILDTLDANLNAKSMQVITSSVPVKVYSFKTTSGLTVAKFDFVNINLPDSTHHGQCEGFLTFSINTKTGLATGTSVNNRASVYFDDNEGVLTNTVSNIIHPLSIHELSGEGQLIIYPNPVNNDLVIKANIAQYNHVMIINAMGQTLMQQQLQPNETHISTRNLIPCMYYIMFKGESGVKVEKIEKL